MSKKNLIFLIVILFSVSACGGSGPSSTAGGGGVNTSTSVTTATALSSQLQSAGLAGNWINISNNAQLIIGLDGSFANSGCGGLVGHIMTISPFPQSACLGGVATCGAGVIRVTSSSGANGCLLVGDAACSYQTVGSTMTLNCGMAQSQMYQSNNVQTSVPVVNTMSDGSVVPVSGGGVQISFSGTNAYTDLPNRLVAGLTSGVSYCGFFSRATTYFCWQFNNNQYQPLNPLTTANTGVPVGTQGTDLLIGSSSIEPGASVTIVSSPTTSGYSSITGIIALPPAFVQYHFPQGLPQVIGLAVDFNVSPKTSAGSYPIKGGVLIYTSGDQNTGYRGAFLGI